MVDAACIRNIFVDFNIHIWNCMNSVAVLRHSRTYVWVSWKPWGSWKNSIEHIKGSTLKMDKAGSFETLITSFQTTHHYMQMTGTLTLRFCGRSSSVDLACSFHSLFSCSSVNQAKLTGPVNGDECHFWRTTGCAFGNKCRYKHMKENKGIDRKPWQKTV
jgi:hypothetical protein